MMEDFDLPQAVDCSPENEPSLFDKEETFKLDEGLQLEVSCNRRTMKRVANLVLVVNRMNKALTCGGSDLTEDKLCSSIMDCVIEEITVKTERRDFTGQKNVTFKRSNSVREFMLRDFLHKDFTLKSGELKLQAITLRTDYQDLRVKFEMFRYCPTYNYNGDGLTILMSVGQEVHISCSMSANKPELHLERCSLEDLKEICENENTNRFLFTKRVEGLSLITFESVKYPGWFISTSCDGTNESVEMCQKTDGRIRCFRVMTNN